MGIWMGILVEYVCIWMGYMEIGIQGYGYGCMRSMPVPTWDASRCNVHKDRGSCSIGATVAPMALSLYGHTTLSLPWLWGYMATRPCRSHGSGAIWPHDPVAPMALALYAHTTLSPPWLWGYIATPPSSSQRPLTLFGLLHKKRSIRPRSPLKRG